MNRILRKTLPLLALLSAAAAVQPAAAQTPCKFPSTDCVAVGDLEVSVSVGYGTRTNPVVGRDDIPLFVVPHVSYYGKRFFLESLEPGVTLYESDAHTFNLIASPGLRPRVLQPQRPAERGRAARRGGAAGLRARSGRRSRT